MNIGDILKAKEYFQNSHCPQKDRYVCYCGVWYYIDENGDTSIIDDINKKQLLSKGALENKLGVSFTKGVILFVYHPVTLEYEHTETQINNILSALRRIDKQIVALYPNLDTGGDIIIDHLRRFAQTNKNVLLFKNLPRMEYLSLLNTVDLLIGNSSSGIVESPYFKLPVVNIGNRQNGRDVSENVIDTDYEKENIIKTIERALYDKKFKNKLKRVKNPYGNGNAAQRIVKALAQIEINKDLLMKKFSKLQ